MLERRIHVAITNTTETPADLRALASPRAIGDGLYPTGEERYSKPQSCPLR